MHKARYRGQIFDQYFVTDDGKVWSDKRRCFLKPYKAHGYYQVDLQTKQPMLHRLIVESLNPGFSGRIIFRNGNTLDCRVENLQLIGEQNEV